MSEDKNRDDVERLVDTLAHGEQRDLITLTETGEADTVDMIRRVCRGGYTVVNPDRGDITFLVHPMHEVLMSGGRLVIPTVHAPARDGGHGPRFVSHVTIALKHAGVTEELTHNGVHFVTRYADHDGRKGDRHDQQLRQARVMGVLMREQGRGTRLSTGSGDLNSVLPQDAGMQRVFDEAGLTTTAHELGVETPTHGSRRIDYVWTRDADRRVVVKGMRVRRGAAWNSDHDPIDVWATIRGSKP
jgi:hypothetical protein